MRKLIFPLLAACILTSCEYRKIEHEIGYKGKARSHPWLAAERLVESMGGKVRSVESWAPPFSMDAVWILPAATLNNDVFTKKMEQWMTDGGHLILLIEHADWETNDWFDYSRTPELNPVLYSMLERSGIHLDQKSESREETTREKIKFAGKFFKVDAKSKLSVHKTGKKPDVFVSKAKGDGRITVLTDGRIFRNRWIGDNDHADLLAALIEATGAEGNVCFVRGTPISFWAMLGEYLWPVLIGLAVWLVLWLWKNLNRFGPVEAESAPPESRGYEHHLEALGDFHWRLDRGASLLAPLRAQIIEAGEKAVVLARLGPGDLYQYLAGRSGLPVERIRQSLAEASPSDPAQLTRTAADLQKLHKTLHNTPRI